MKRTLFDATKLGEITLPNRLVMAPMTRNRATPGGVPTDLVAEYYAQRASAGLIIAEASTPNAIGQTYPNITAIYNDDHVAGWQGVTDAVQRAGGRMFLQVQHGGRVGHPQTTGMTPIAPSSVPLPTPIHTATGRQRPVVPRAMTRTDIETTISDFAAASGRAVVAGFAGVEIHSANGYLLHQFLAENTNRRDDEYGGSIDRRIRFVVEVVRAVCETIGPDRVGLRISPGNPANGIVEGGRTLELYERLIAALADLPMSYLHLRYAEPHEPVFAAVRDAWAGTLIANPVLPQAQIPADGGKRAAGEMLAAGADLIALGRPFLGNPDLVHRFRLGACANPIEDAYLMYIGGSTGYTDYPLLAPAAP